ncbi:hypothetical protein ACWEVY_28640 [Streptomyces longwoodensis]
MSYLKSCSDVPKDAVTGTLNGREPGETTVYLIHSGGYRRKRSRMDRADFIYDVYGQSPAEAGQLAYVVRDYLLEDLPGKSLGGYLVLDVRDLSSPHWHPDQQSDEPAFTGEVALYLTPND